MTFSRSLATTKVIGCLTLFILFLFLLPYSLSAALPTSKPTLETIIRAQGQDQDDDVVRVNADLVVLNATVLDKEGKFVGSLKRNDFKVFEDGTEQALASFNSEETPFAAAILLDTSGSMETRLTLGRSAAIRFLDGLRDEDVAAVYSFDSKVEQMQDYSPGRDLAPKVFTLKTKLMTALNDAVLRAADDLAKRPEKRRAIVVLSDGGENYSRASADKALDHAFQAGATIYAVNLSETGPSRDILGTGILKNFAEKSGGEYIAAPGGQALRDAFAGIAEELGHQYTLAYRPSNRQHDGKWRAINVKVARDGVTLRTRKGYKAPKS
jgi:Ca-activated chloride channel homolog